MKIKPISNYIPVVDTLHLNLVKDLNPNTDLILTNHNPINLLSITKANANDTYKSGGFKLERFFKIKNNQFNLQYAVKINNTEIGSLFLNRKDGFNNQNNFMRLNLHNSILYTDWVPMLTSFLKSFELEIYSFPQLHIALDTNQKVIQNFYKLQDSDDYVMNHGRKLTESVQVKGKRLKGNVREDSILLGSSKSIKQTCIYSKTKELLTSQKPYISQWHKDNNLIGDEIQRIELKLNNDTFNIYKTLFVNEDAEFLTRHTKKRLSIDDTRPTFEPKTAIIKTDIDYLKLRNPHYLVSLFEKFSNIDFRKNDNKNISRCTRFEFIDYNTYQKEDIIMATILGLTQKG